MDPSCLVSTVQAGGGGVIVWGIFSWHTLGPLVPTEHCLNTTAYLSIVSDHVHPFMTTVYPSADGYFQQDNAPCHKAQIISDMTMSSPQSNGLHSHQISIQYSTFGMWWNERSWMCNWQICSNCVMLSCQYGPKSLRNVSHTLLNLCHEWIKAVLKAKGGHQHNVNSVLCERVYSKRKWLWKKETCHFLCPP